MAQCLKDLETVNLKTSRKAQVTALHKFIFEEEGDRGNRQRIRMFEGFSFDEAQPEYNKKKQYVQGNLANADLTAICLLLGLKHDDEDLYAYLFRNLRKYHLLQDAATDNEDEDETTDAEEAEIIAEQEESVVYNSGNDNEENYRAMPSTSRKSSRATIEGDGQTASMTALRVTFNFRDVEDLMEKFTGDDHPSIWSWTHDFEETAQTYQWNELEKVTFARRLLQGSAKRFVRYEKCGKTWPQLKKNLMREFGEVVDSKKVHRELGKRKIKPDESNQDYIQPWTYKWHNILLKTNV